MARKVFVSSDISHDEDLLEVARAAPNAALLWPWLLTAFDDWGRARADARRLKAQIWPMIDTVTVELIDQALTLFAEKGLIDLYDAGDMRVMAIEEGKWRRFQTHIRWDRKAAHTTSSLPAPARHLPGTIPAPDGTLPDDARHVPGYSTPSPSPSPSEVSTARSEGLTTPGEETTGVTTRAERALETWADIVGTQPTRTFIRKTIGAAGTFLRAHPELQNGQLETYLQWAAEAGCVHPNGWETWHIQYQRKAKTAKPQLPDCTTCDNRRLVGHIDGKIVPAETMDAEITVCPDCHPMAVGRREETR